MYKVRHRGDWGDFQIRVLKVDEKFVKGMVLEEGCHPLSSPAHRPGDIVRLRTDRRDIKLVPVPGPLG